MQFQNIQWLFIRRVALVVAVLLVFACSGAVDDKQSVLSAKQYIEQNKLREAALELKNALQSNSSNAEARYLLGQLNITIGDMAAAAKEFRKAQQAGWDESQSQVGLARALVNSHEFKKVINDVQIKKNYSDKARADLYGLKAFSYAAMGDSKQAEKLIAQGKALDASAFQILKTSIQLKVTAKNAKQKEIKVALKQALSLYPDNSELLLLDAFDAIQLKNFKTAAESFDKVISQDPENLVSYNGRRARLGLARLKIIEKNFDHAKTLLAPLFKQSGSDPETNYIGALLAFEQKNFDLAEERLLKVLKVAPEHAKSQLLFGTVNFAQKDYEQAAYYIGKYLKQEPGNIGARKLLGRTYLLMGQHKQAQAVLKPGVSGGDAELLALVGLSQIKSGDTLSGISDLKKAVDVAPESQSLRGELAKAYITVGETDKAIKQLNQVLTEGGNKNQAEILKISAYLHDQQFDRAINLALDILERNPQDPAILSMVGNVFAASGDRAEARKYFNKAREVDSTYTQATMLLAALDELEGNTKQAESLYRSIDVNKPASVDHLLALARLSGKRGDEPGMVQWLEKARQRLSTDLRSRLVLAEVYLRNKRIDKVENLVKELLEIAPNDPRVLMLQGKALMVQQRFNEALKPLNKLVTRESKAIAGRVLLGEAYLRLGQNHDARRQFELALKINEFDTVTLVLMANLEWAEGHFDKALLYSQKIQKIKPDLYLGYELEGNTRLAGKNYHAAEVAFARTMQLHPASSVAIKLAGVLLKLNRQGEAKQILLQWLKKHPQDFKVLQHLGGVYLSQNESDKAIEAFEKVIKVQPNNAVALNNLAWLYALAKNPAALEMAERVYRLLPDNAGIQDTYGWVLVNNGKLVKGRQVLEQAIKALPDDADVQYHYAVALAKSGESVEAKKRLRRLLKNQSSFTGREDARALLQSLQ